MENFLLIKSPRLARQLVNRYQSRITTLQFRKQVSQLTKYLVLGLFLIPTGLMAQTISWTGGGDGTSWNQAENWNENRIPGPTDDVVISLDGTYTIQQPAAANITINSLTFGADQGTQTLIKTNSTFTLNAESSIGANAILQLNAGYLAGNGSLENNGLIISDAANWSGLNNFTLVNNGVIEQINGIFYMATGSVLENNGQYDIQNDVNVFQSGSASSFVNTGRILKSVTDDGTSIITVPLDSRPESVIESTAGAIYLQGASVYHDITLVADAVDTEIQFQSRTQTFRGTISGSPNGLVVLNTPAEAHPEGATFDFGGTGLTWISNYMQAGGPFTNSGLIRLNATNWTGLNQATLTNNGTIEQINGIFYMTSGSTLENNGLYDIQGDHRMLQSGSASTFINNNRLLKSAAGDGVAIITVPLENRPESILESSAGEIQLQGLSTHHNTTLVVDDPDAIIRFQTNRQTFRGTISGDPTGLVILNAPAEAHEQGATFDLGGSGLTWTSNYMQGGGTFTNNNLIRLNATNWTGLNGSALINNGIIEHVNGIFYMTSGAQLENRNLYDIQNDVSVFQSGSVSSFVNSGRLVKSVSGDGVSRMTVPVDSRAESIIESAAGELQLQGASFYHNMSFVADSEESTIRFATATHTFRGSITGSPAGSVILNANAEAHEEGTTFNFSGTGLTWISNSMIGGGTFTNDGFITLDAANWTGVNGSTLINNGTIEQMNGIFYLTGGALLENNDRFIAEGGRGIFQSGSLSTFTNNDRLLLNSLNDPYTISTRIVNNSSATIDVQQGNVRLTNAGEHNAPTFAVSEDASLSFYSGNHVFNGPITTQPAGDFIIRTNFSTESGSTQFNITGTGLYWENGELTSGTITNTGSITMPGGGSTGLNGGTLINAGEMTLMGSNFRIMHPGELQNESTFTVADDFNIFTGSPEPGRFINSGLFHKSGGESISQVRSQMINESEGEIRLTAGETRFLSRFEHKKDASITGNGIIDLARAESFLKGSITPGNPLGSLNFVGDYEPNDTTSALNISLFQTDSETPEPANTMLSIRETDYRVGFRTLGGSATLAGELFIETETDFIPDPGTEFEVIRATKGLSGGFSSYSGLVNVTNQRAFYPQLRDTSLILVTNEGVPSLSGEIMADPVSIQAGDEQMITFTGTGFPPDISVELNCIECFEPETFGTISGRVGSISTDTAEVWFDLSNALISGTYEAVLNDPRGGQASQTIQINQGPPALTIISIAPVLDIQTTDPGKLIIQADRIMDQDLSIPVTISGSARIYEDYVSDFSGSRAVIQSGSDRFVMNVFPTSNSESNGPSTVSLLINSSDDYTLESSFSTITIAERPQTAEFDIYALTPSYGGTGGSVSSEIVGTGISQNATVKLVKGGSEIQGTNVNVRENGSALTTTFQLSDTELGLWSVIVTNQGGESKEISQGFTVVNRVRHSVVADIIAPPRVARGRNNLYKLSFRNTGNNDVLGIPGLVGLPADAAWEIINRTSDENDLSLDDFVTTQISDNNRKSLRFWPMRIPPGATVNLDIQIAMPNTGIVRFRPVWFGS